ncbi:putative short chain dehydrogenase/reductase [Camillea tinctor]|nr:putative short chain dehydrogenase/reductase [Camillea tinctor]
MLILNSGANSGIGYETAISLATACTISVIRVDITNKETINATKENINLKFGKLNVLINNAGISHPLLRKSVNPYIIYISSALGSVTLRLDPDREHREIRSDTCRMSKSALNMLAACQRYNYAEWGCNVLAFNPGWCISNRTGESGREIRSKGGARSPKEPAIALVDIVLGKRDDDVEKNGMLDLDGGILPW